MTVVLAAGKDADQNLPAAGFVHTEKQYDCGV